MAKRGPARTPTAILELTGSKLAKGRAEGEVRPATTTTDPPAWMTAKGKVEWVRIAAVLMPLGLLTDADHAALERYCEMLVRWRMALKVVNGKKGAVLEVKNKRGAVVSSKPRAEMVILTRLDAALTKLEQQFGLTPAARAGLSIEDLKDKKGGAKVVTMDDLFKDHDWGT